MTASSSSWKPTFWIVLFGLGGLLGLAWLPVDRTYLREQEQLLAFKQLNTKWQQELQELENIAFSIPWQGIHSLISSPTKGSTLSNSLTTSLQHRLFLLMEAFQQQHAHITCLPAPCSKRFLWEIKRLDLFKPIPANKSARLEVTLHFQTRQPSTWQLSREVWLRAQVEHRSAKGLASHRPTPPTSQPSSRASNDPTSTSQSPAYQLLWKGEATQRAVHWSSALPPIAAIFFALMTRRILLSLFLSLLLGTFLLKLSVLGGVHSLLSVYVWEKSIYKEFSLNIIIFTLALIGMINVCTRNGGVRGLIDKLIRYASTARSSRLMTALLGLLIFFDDYANTIMVGNTMRPLTDRYRVSREKLAYLVDSTAAPIAGVAILSTWIGYEVGLLGDIATHIGIPMSGYQLFLSSLPFRFYCWFTLLFVFVNVFSNRDFGPMWEAENRAWTEGKLLRDGAQPMIDLDMDRLNPPEGAPHRWLNVMAPVFLVLCSVVGGLLWVGGWFEGQSIYEALKTASYNSSRIFLVSALLGSALAIGLSVGQRILTLKDAVWTWLTGARAMGFAVGILIFAWSMSALAEDLGTAYYLIALLKGSLRPELVPLLVFFMSAAISFATGTSWGTMGILLPTIAPLAYAIGGPAVLILSVGAVLDGSIFGDHCSPLSDTTLFSSAASACDHIDHVKTQVPYALTVMLIAASMGYLAVPFGLSVFLAMPLGLCAFIMIFVFFGRPSSPSTPSLTPPSMQ